MYLGVIGVTSRKTYLDPGVPLFEPFLDDRHRVIHGPLFCGGQRFSQIQRDRLIRSAGPLDDGHTGFEKTALQLLAVHVDEEDILL